MKSGSQAVNGVWQQIFPLSMDLTGKHSNQTLQTQKKMVIHKHHGSGL